MAAIYAELMEREFPGQKFVVQGGDWGSFTTGMIVGHFSDRLLGFHVNMFIAPDANHDLRIIPWQVRYIVLRYFNNRSVTYFFILF